MVGGTPSYIDEKYIKEIIQEIESKLVNNKTKFEDIEITIEINPGTITKKKIETYKKSKINRISIGLQSANNDLLKQIGRIHDYEEFLQSYELVKNAGFENINVDLMIGLPNQTMQDVKTTLNKILHLKPSHISIYSLIIEEGTKIEKLISEKKLQLIDENIERQMYWYVKNTLEINGYIHYEISNFAKEKKMSKHNLNCWEQKEYIGIGVAAHSYLDGIRYSNMDFTKDEIWSFKNKKIEEEQTLDEMKKEYMLLGLRKIEGVSIKAFKAKYIENPVFLYKYEIEKLQKEGLLEIDGDFIRLTSKGIDFANLVWEEFV